MPVVSGPHVFNFAEVYEAMVAADAAIVAGFEELSAELETLVTDEIRRKVMSGAAASRVFIKRDDGRLAEHYASRPNPHASADHPPYSGSAQAAYGLCPA